MVSPEGGDPVPSGRSGSEAVRGPGPGQVTRGLAPEPSVGRLDLAPGSGTARPLRPTPSGKPGGGCAGSSLEEGLARPVSTGGRALPGRVGSPSAPERLPERRGGSPATTGRCLIPRGGGRCVESELRAPCAPPVSQGPPEGH